MSERIDRMVDSSGTDIGEPAKWVDQLQMASFRDVPFHVDSVEWTVGANTVLREYPFQDLPTVFSMGRAAQMLRFSAYVIGEDYHLQRAALIEALEGPGKLVHPTAGAMYVFVVGSYPIREAPTSEGGMARFDLTFVRADDRRYPVGVANKQQGATEAADKAKASSKSQFASAWGLDGKPGWAADRAVARIKGSVDSVWSRISKLTKTVNDFNSTLIGNYQVLRDGLNDLVRTPRLLADSVANLFTLPADLTAAAARDFQSAFSWLFDLESRIDRSDFEVSVIPPVGAGLVMFGTGVAGSGGGTSETRQQLNLMASASDQLFETLATAAYVQATAVVELANYDEAMAMRSTIHQQFTRLLRSASASAAGDALAESSWHDAMMSLHTAALADLQARSRDLVRLTTYTPQSWQPVWYISHRLFGTADYADEIMAMNPHIEHPLLVPPGVPLRIVRHET